MRTAVPKEVTNHEYRVALTPAGVHHLTRRGHQLTVEERASAGTVTSATVAAAPDLAGAALAEAMG